MGLEEIGDSEVKLGFPDPNDLTQTICMPAWSGLAHRFIAVAVSKSGEDPAGGFYTYILVDDYADWPQFTVHDDYLVLNHRAAGSTTYVFDAKTLADGSAGDSSALEIKPLLTIDAAALRARLPFNVPTTALMPATVHGDSDRVTYLAAGFGSLLVVYGLLSPPNHPESAPSFMSPALVSIGNELHGMTNRPVFQSGMLHLVGYECALSVPELPCEKYITRIVRFLVARVGNALITSGSASKEFINETIGDSPDDLSSFELPAIEVTDAGDMVVVYDRARLFPTIEVPASARYSVRFHDVPGISHGAPLQDAIGDIVPCNTDKKIFKTYPVRVDLGGIALDPVPDKSGHHSTVWMSHAFTHPSAKPPPTGCPEGPQSSYAAVFGAVTP